MTQLFQPLDLTVNGAAKAYMQRRFTEWYSKCIAVQLDEDKEIEDVDVQLKLSVLKPLHTNWIIDLFNYFTSEKGREIISNGWKAAFISEAMSPGSHGLESLDPFQDVDSLVGNGSSTFETNVKVADNDIDFFVIPKSFEDSEDTYSWETSDGQNMNNIFEIFEDIVEESFLWILF